jgi:hypothetical protein
MIEMLSSSVASLEPPPIVTTTLEASATKTTMVVAPLPIEIASEPQGQASALASTSQLADPAAETAEQTQTASLIVLELEGQPPLAPADLIVLSPESEDDAT